MRADVEPGGADMAINGVLAQATVRDTAAAEEWYTKLFDRGPDRRPMDGLIEWHFGDAAGVQVWAEPERAGRSSLVLQVDDLDAFAARLVDAGLSAAEPRQATSSRVLPIEDPDGNRIVLTGV
jgi:predicted enzyme related to lactoylglutathione lyase